MDRYSKTVLTMIALSLAFIAVKMWQPQEAHTGVFSGGPTRGDLLDLREIKDSAKRRETRVRLLRSIPLVRIEGGHVEVSGDVGVSGTVEIDN